MTASLAYIDAVGGLAGDMLLAALLDAGASEELLRAVPERIGLHDVELRSRRVERHGIGALHVEVLVGGKNARGDAASGWQAIRRQLQEADLDEHVRARAIAVFQRLAEVEAAIHGTDVDSIHFHELGAVDTLVDIVGAITLLAELGVDRLVCSPLPLGRGTVLAAHGVLPLPAPATVSLLRGRPVFGVELEAELVTPTGAALATVLSHDWGVIPPMSIERVGYGAGTADFRERANLIRLLVGHAVNEPTAGAHGNVTLLETNLDDLNPELVPDAAARCFAAGALDVWTAPVTMKKGRPGIVFSALARPAAEVSVARAMLEETSALGVRMSPARRIELAREQRTVIVAGHEVRLKFGVLDGRVVNVAPEHDDCAVAARAGGVPVKDVWAEAMAAGRDLLEQ